MISPLTKVLHGLQCTLLLLFLQSSVLAQSGIILNDGNLSYVMEELEYLYDQDINIPIEDVKLFLEENITGNYNALLDPPLGQVVYEDENVIELGWTPNSDETIVRLIDLETGVSDEKTLDTGNYTFTLDDHLFLFTFQSLNEHGEKGPSWIIIEDKIFGFALNENRCNCRYSTAASNLPAQNDYSLLYGDFDPNENEVTLHFDINYQNDFGTNIEGDFMVYITRSDNEITTVAMIYSNSESNVCMFNAETDYNFIYAVDPESINGGFLDHNPIIKIMFAPQGIYFRKMDSAYAGNIQLTKCSGTANEGGGKIKRLANKEKGMSLPFPNPTNAILHLPLKIENNSLTKINIKNYLGQLVKTQEVDAKVQSHPYYFEMDLNQLPTGQYHAELISGSQISTYSFIKID